MRTVAEFLAASRVLLAPVFSHTRVEKIEIRGQEGLMKGGEICERWFEENHC